MSGKVYGYQIWMQAKDLLPTVLVSIVAAFFAYLPLYLNLITHDLALIIVQTLIFVIIYLGASHVLKNDIWLEILGMLKKKLAK